MEGCLQIRVMNALEQVAQAALEYLQGPRLAVSGGTTFAAMFPLWASSVQARVKAGTPLRFFPVDERRVAFADEACNWRTCCEALLEPAGLGLQRAHWATSAAQYSDVLEREFGADPVVFDQIFLGVGEDGHTASLFPESAALRDRKSIVIDVTGPKPPPQRVTLGLRTLWDCRTLVCVALGEAKAPAVKRLREGDMELPITQAVAGHGRAILLLDQAAAGG